MDARQRGRLQEAESLLSQATEKCPLDEKIRSHYSETLWDSGQRDLAVANMEEAVRLSGGDMDRVVRLGEMYLAQGDLDRAAAQAETAIQANRPRADAWALRGNVLRAQKRDRESLAAYHRALSYQEHYPSVQLAIAAIYRRQGRHSRELATLRSLADGYPPGEMPHRVQYLEGLALKELRRYQAAADVLASAAARGEVSSELLYHLAESQWLAGDPVNARLTLQSALQQSQHEPAGQQTAAALLALQRKLSETSRM
jgi:Flp pilus assembly protein TadD